MVEWLRLPEHFEAPLEVHDLFAASRTSTFAQNARGNNALEVNRGKLRVNCG